ncbi:hypothetical protein ACO0SA_001067 [Hanseniaspora valbyensis]
MSVETTDTKAFEEGKKILCKTDMERSSFETISLSSIDDENEATLEEQNSKAHSINSKFKNYHDKVLQTEQQKIKELTLSLNHMKKEVKFLKNENDTLKNELKKEKYMIKMVMLKIAQKLK